MAPPYSTGNEINEQNMTDAQAVVLSAIVNSLQYDGVRSGEDEPNRLSRSYSLTRSSTSSSSPGRGEVADGNPEGLPIGPDLYRLLVNGDKDQLLAYQPQFHISQSGNNSTIWELMTTKDKSTVLHIAAGAGHVQLIAEFLLPRCNALAKKKNSKGDLPFHSAAKAGHLGALKALTTWESYPSSEGIGRELLGEVNNEADSPLHIALENNELEMAWHLMEKYGEACYQSNQMRVCPLYMAIKAGYWELVKHMVSFTIDRKPSSGNALLLCKSIVHAAIAQRQQNLEILKMILDNHGNLIESLNEDGQTPFSYAAFKGYHEVVHYLLGEFPSYAFKCDDKKDGSFPIHSAASGGHIKVMKMLHHSKQLLNSKGQNIFHVAAWNGKSEVVSYLLNVREFEKLINSKDEDGNTPLHLAAKGFHPRVVYMLTGEKRVKIELQNKHGLTALDVAEIHAGPSPPFEARLTWMALRYVDAPRSSQSTRKNYFQKKKQMMEEIIMKAPENNNLENYRDRIGTQLLVATLVATVTFAAGFTLPGGYFQSDSHIGMAVLSHKWAFQVFMICDTAAMYSSILAVVTLIWAQLGDLKLVLLSFKFALALLGFSLAMMSLAFMMGVFIMLRNTLWLSYVILGMGSLFLVFVLVVFIPLYSPSYIRRSEVRFFFSGTFLLLLLVCEKSKVKYS